MIPKAARSEQRFCISNLTDLLFRASPKESLYLQSVECMVPYVVLRERSGGGRGISGGLPPL